MARGKPKASAAPPAGLAGAPGPKSRGRNLMQETFDAADALGDGGLQRRIADREALRQFPAIKVRASATEANLAAALHHWTYYLAGLIPETDLPRDDVDGRLRRIEQECLTMGATMPTLAALEVYGEQYIDGSRSSLGIDGVTKMSAASLRAVMMRTMSALTRKTRVPWPKSTVEGIEIWLHNASRDQDNLLVRNVRRKKPAATEADVCDVLADLADREQGVLLGCVEQALQASAIIMVDEHWGVRPGCRTLKAHLLAKPHMTLLWEDLTFYYLGRREEDDEPIFELVAEFKWVKNQELNEDDNLLTNAHSLRLSNIFRDLTFTLLVLAHSRGVLAFDLVDLLTNPPDEPGPLELRDDRAAWPVFVQPGAFTNKAGPAAKVKAKAAASTGVGADAAVDARRRRRGTQSSADYSVPMTTSTSTKIYSDIGWHSWQARFTAYMLRRRHMWALVSQMSTVRLIRLQFATAWLLERAALTQYLVQLNFDYYTGHGKASKQFATAYQGDDRDVDISYSRLGAEVAGERREGRRARVSTEANAGAQPKTANQLRELKDKLENTLAKLAKKYPDGVPDPKPVVVDEAGEADEGKDEDPLVTSLFSGLSRVQALLARLEREGRPVAAGEPEPEGEPSAADDIVHKHPLKGLDLSQLTSLFPPTVSHVTHEPSPVDLAARAAAVLAVATGAMAHPYAKIALGAARGQGSAAVLDEITRRLREERATIDGECLLCQEEGLTKENGSAKVHPRLSAHALEHERTKHAATHHQCCVCGALVAFDDADGDSGGVEHLLACYESHASLVESRVAALDSSSEVGKQEPRLDVSTHADEEPAIAEVAAASSSRRKEGEARVVGRASSDGGGELREEDSVMRAEVVEDRL